MWPKLDLTGLVKEEFYFPAIIAWGREGEWKEKKTQTWRQGIRVSADELADAAGSMGVSWQGKQ